MLLEFLPSCFSSSTSNEMKQTQKVSQNIVTCIYQTLICNSPTFLTLTWCKTLSTHSVTINIDSSSLSISISISPSSALSLFKNKRGSKTIPITSHHHCHRTHTLCWDFTRAQFSPSSAVPISGFYIGITHETRAEFAIGDMVDNLARRYGVGAIDALVADPKMLSQREHVFGQRRFASHARFLGSSHEIGIEWGDGSLRVKVDSVEALVVKRVAWKFRGKEKILVGVYDVEFYWDVFNWVCGPGCAGNGIFVFQVGDGGVWPEMIGPEKRLMKSCRSTSPSSSMSPGNWSVLQWSEERSDGGRSFCSSTSSSSRSSTYSSFCEVNAGFTLLLYAWKTD